MYIAAVLNNWKAHHENEKEIEREEGGVDGNYHSFLINVEGKGERMEEAAMKRGGGSYHVQGLIGSR